MIRLRQQHWTLAFLLALAIHVAVYLYSVVLPGSAPVYRGGGAFDLGEKQSTSAAGVFVQLGKSGESAGDKAPKSALKEQSPAPKPRESLAQGFVAGNDEPGTDQKSKKPPEPAEPASKRISKKTFSTAESEPGPTTKKIKKEEKPKTKIVTAPAPKRKPKRPTLLPELETIGQRLSVQGPPQTAKSNTGDGGAKEGEKSLSSLSFASKGGRLGTASGDKTGDIRALNYEDQVMLWLKRHGSYPYEAAMYRLEDTVTLKFAINRQGKILFYELTKKSKWHLFNQAVERMMDRSSPVPPIPPEISKNKMTFTIPVHFDPYHRQ